MKLFFAFIFILLFPAVIFLSSIVSAPDITPILKSDLQKQHIYKELSSQIDTLESKNSDSADINMYIHNKFTASYIRKKVETALDSSSDWISGKSPTPPAVSFKDIKNDLNTQYPQLLPAIQSAADEMKQKQSQLADSGNMQATTQNTQGTAMLASLTKSNFTVPLTPYLSGLKNFYATVKILQPILAILLVICIVFLFILNKPWPQRFKWIGITLFISSLVGFGLAFGNVFIIQFLSKFAAHNANHIVQLASPIVLQIINHYVDVYVNYQKMASLVLLIIAAGCFVGAAVTRNTPVTVGKPTVSKKR